MPKRIAIVPGTFDPVHYGHIDTLRQSAQTFDTLYWTILKNPAKHSHMFTQEERMAMMSHVARDFPNVIVDSFDGLIWDYARMRSAIHIVRSMRLVMEHQTELTYTLNIRMHAPELVMTYFLPMQSHFHISSTDVRFAIGCNQSLKMYVPPAVEKHIEMWRSAKARST